MIPDAVHHRCCRFTNCDERSIATLADSLTIRAFTTYVNRLQAGGGGGGGAPMHSNTTRAAGRVEPVKGGGIK